jgi:hypothetical protein
MSAFRPILAAVGLTGLVTAQVHVSFPTQDGGIALAGPAQPFRRATQGWKSFATQDLISALRRDPMGAVT